VQHDRELVDLLDCDSIDQVLDRLAASLLRKLSRLHGGTSSEELESLVGTIPGEAKSGVRPNGIRAPSILACRSRIVGKSIEQSRPGDLSGPKAGHTEIFIWRVVILVSG
jgi:hypothetical protein